MDGDIIKIDYTAFDFGSNMESDGTQVNQYMVSKDANTTQLEQADKMLDFSKPKYPVLGEPSSSQSKYKELDNYASQNDDNLKTEMCLFNNRGILDINYSSPANLEAPTTATQNQFRERDHDAAVNLEHLDSVHKHKRPAKKAKKPEPNFNAQLTFREDLVGGPVQRREALYLSGASNNAKGYHSTQTAFGKQEPQGLRCKRKSHSRSTSKSKSKVNTLQNFELIKRLIGGKQSAKAKSKALKYDKSVAEKLRDHLLAKTNSAEVNQFERSYRTPDLSKQGAAGLHIQSGAGDKRRNLSRPGPNHQQLPIRTSGKKPKKRLKCTLKSVEEITSRLRTRSTM